MRKTMLEKNVSWLLRKFFKKNNSLLNSHTKKSMGVIKRNFSKTKVLLDTNEVLKSRYPDITIPNLTVCEYIWRDYESRSDYPALTCGATGRSYTYGELRVLSRRMAGSLLSSVGLKPGDVIGLILPNIPEFAIICLGAIEAGIVVTLANPLYTAGEIHRQFSDSQVKMIVCVSPLIQEARDVGSTNKDFKGLMVIGAEDFDIITGDERTTFSFAEVLMDAEDTVNLPKVNPADLALLPYSSGTMGVPKGVMLSHKNLVANICQLLHPKLIGAVETTNIYQEKAFSVLPFFHIYGFTLVNLCLSYGIHVITMPKFVPEVYIGVLMEYKPHTLFVVPSLLNLLASHSSVEREHLSCVQQVISGAAPSSISLIEKFSRKVGRQDIKIRQGYGMTETSPATLLTPIDMPSSKHGSCGLLLPNTNARVMDLEKEVAVGPNRTGELQFKGPQVMMGYYNNPKATKDTMTSTGWLMTGDVGYYDEDGYFFIVDRTKELIKVKGNQVSPTELEDIIRRMPGVIDVAVVGVPDELAGEIPRAFVVCEKGEHEVTEDSVKKFVHHQVVKYKYLEGGVRFVSEIPRNVSGKILRNELKVLSGHSKFSCSKDKK